jgi:MSHA biogenesis protein MshE
LGREAVNELLEMNAELADALKREDSSGFAQIAKKKKDFKPLVLGVLDLAVAGKTTLEEVFKMVSDIENESEDLASSMKSKTDFTGIRI